MKSGRKTPRLIPFWLENLFSVVTLISLSTIFAGSVLEWRYQNSLLETLKVAEPLPQALAHDPFSVIHLEARSAIVIDATTGTKIFGQNEQAQLPLASLTKLMTALIASETVPDFTTITVSVTSSEQDGKLRAGERWRLKDLIDYTLISSSNYGADSIASVIGAIQSGQSNTEGSGNKYTATFITTMNAAAARLGLNQTYFLNGTGLDIDTQTGGAYGSAEDIAKLFAYILKNNPRLVEDTKYPVKSFKSLDNHTVEAINTDIIINKIPGLLASKTGFTDLAGGNLAIAFDASVGEPFIVVVLGSTQSGRFEDTQKLLAATIEYLGTRYGN